jgi:hypothetical protein
MPLWPLTALETIFKADDFLHQPHICLISRSTLRWMLCQTVKLRYHDLSPLFCTLKRRDRHSELYMTESTSVHLITACNI